MPSQKAWEEWKAREVARKSANKDDAVLVKSVTQLLRSRAAELDFQIAQLLKLGKQK